MYRIQIIMNLFFSYCGQKSWKPKSGNIVVRWMSVWLNSNAQWFLGNGCVTSSQEQGSILPFPTPILYLVPILLPKSSPAMKVILQGKKCLRGITRPESLPCAEISLISCTSSLSPSLGAGAGLSVRFLGYLRVNIFWEFTTLFYGWVFKPICFFHGSCM